MTDMLYEQEILAELRKLQPEQQRKVLAYTRALQTRPKGISGKEAIRIAREINFDPAELALMQQAIEAAKYQADMTCHVPTQTVNSSRITGS